MSMGIKMAEKSGTYEATLEILLIEAEIELKHTDNQDMIKFLEKQIDYINRQLQKGKAVA